MSIQRMVDLDLSGKRVLIRQDLNVPVKNGKVTSDIRIRPVFQPLKKPWPQEQQLCCYHILAVLLKDSMMKHLL